MASVAGSQVTTGQITAADVGWRPSSVSPWPPSADAVLLGRDALNHLDDELAIDVVEHLVSTLVDVRDELRAVRAALSETLALLHDEQRETVRLKQRNISLLSDRRGRPATS